MATRSRIGIRINEYQVRSIYCHWDGYPEGVGNELVTRFNSRKLAEKLIELGHRSYLIPADENEFQKELYNKPADTHSYDEWTKILYNPPSWEDYVYEWNDGFGWIVYYDSNKRKILSPKNLSVAEENGLNLKYRPDFDEAFDIALELFESENKALDLINKGTVLYVSDDFKLAPKFIKPKGIGFIVYNTSIENPSSSVESVIGTLSKNPKVVQIFNDNYGIIDIEYIEDFFKDTSNWKAITSKDELDNFIALLS